MKTKFVLIERGEGFKNTYTTERVAIDALKRGSIQSYRPVTLKEIKSLRANEYRELLIAAAPELFNASIALLDALKYGHQGDIDVFTYDLKQAVNKAKGTNEQKTNRKLPRE